MDNYISKPVGIAEFYETPDMLITERVPGGAITSPAEVSSSKDHRPPAFDRQAALDRVEDDLQLLVELADMFLSDVPAQLANLAEAVKRGDSEALRIAAHTLKGSAANFSAAPIVQSARQLEALGCERNMGPAPAALATVETEMDRLCEALSALVSEEKSHTPAAQCGV